MRKIEDIVLFRLWCKILNENNNIISEVTIEDSSDVNRTKKVLGALSSGCLELDLAEPIWLESNINEFRAHSKTRFGKDSFIEGIDFNALEIEVIEE